MPNAFTTGLLGGLSQGFTQQWEKQDEAKRTEKKQKLEDLNRILLSPNVPGDQKDRVLGEYEKLSGIGGGGKGSSKGKGNPIWDRVKGLIHGGGQQPGGQQPGGQQPGGQQPGGQQPSPQQGAQPRELQIDPSNGWPTLRREGGPAPETTQRQAQDPTAPVPGMAGVNQGQLAQPAPYDYRADLQKRLNQAQNRAESLSRAGKSYSASDANNEVYAIQEKLDKLSQGEAAESGKEAIQRLNSRAAEEKAEMIERHKTEREEAALNGKKAVEVATAQHRKELKEQEEKFAKEMESEKEKNRVTLKKTVPGKAPGTPKATGPTAAQRQKLSNSLDDQHTRELDRIDDEYDRSTRALERNQTLSSNEKRKQLEELKAEAKKKKQRADQEYGQKRQRASGGSGGQTTSGSTGGSATPEVHRAVDAHGNTIEYDGTAWRPVPKQ